MSHKYSIEKLWHFRCERCDKWWTIGDFQEGEGDEVGCPICGWWSEYEGVVTKQISLPKEYE